MTDPNPWVTAAVMDAGSAADPDTAPAQPPRGPDRPQPEMVSPPRSGGLPVVPVTGQVWPPGGDANAYWWWAGCHGGAGVTTLIRLTGAGRDARRAWPLPAAGESKVVLVARTHLDGLRAALQAATQWAAGRVPDQIHLLGLVLVADAPGRLPRDLRELAQVVEGGVPRMWEIRWHERLRFDPMMAGLAARLPGDYRQVAVELARLCGREHRRG